MSKTYTAARVTQIAGEYVVVDPNGLTIASCADRSSDAHLIAEALNLYDPMLEALRQIFDMDAGHQTRETAINMRTTARAAIAKAT